MWIPSLNYANEENLEAVPVAVVTEEPRLVLVWRDKEIVNISRAISGYQWRSSGNRCGSGDPEPGRLYAYRTQRRTGCESTNGWETLADLNVCSQKGPCGDVRRLYRERQAY